MVFSTRDFGRKWGLIISLIAFIYLSQTSIKGVFGIPSIIDYVNITIPESLFGINLTITSWLLLIIGLIIFFMALFDIKPFDF